MFSGFSHANSVCFEILPPQMLLLQPLMRTLRMTLSLGEVTLKFLQLLKPLELRQPRGGVGGGGFQSLRATQPRLGAAPLYPAIYSNIQ